MGLMYIGATLRNAGHKPRIHDCACDHDGLQVLRKTIIDWKPDFIGLSIIITEVEEAKRIMKLIREVIPTSPVIFGGPWPSSNPLESLQTFGADYVVMGEGELVFPRLLDALNAGSSFSSMLGTASSINGSVKINQRRLLTEEELDALPFPAWDLLDHELYAKMRSMPGVGRRSYMSIVTSRGCPYRCIYCHQTMGKRFRKRSPGSVISEIETLRFKYGFKEFEILDDCFNLDRKRMRAILEGIRDRIGDVRLHFPNAVRSDIIEPEDMSLFKQAGTISASFAIETASPRIQKMIRKNLNLEKATRTINAAVKEGIYSTGYFMIGFPTETYQEASETVKFAIHSQLHRALFFNPKPFAGTELAEMAADILGDKELLDPCIMNYHDSALNISSMSDEELREVSKKAYKNFYLNLKRIFRLMKLTIRHPELFALKRLFGMFVITFLNIKTKESSVK
jgi:radical SAM superfamily enzyme YgiQ (UPF0313 family)